MNTIKYLFAFLLISSICLPAKAQQMSKEDLIAMTPDWKGDRFPDGRPKVPDDIISRMKLVTIEEAWATIKGRGFAHAYEGGWEIVNPDGVLVGRALTAQFMPGRPDLHGAMDTHGHATGFQRSQNSWPVDKLQPGDVYVADQFNATVDGPTVGDNVANAIYSNSGGNGFVYNGAIRDLHGLKQLDFTVYYRSYHPSYHNPPSDRNNTVLVSVNGPTRIGDITVMPGDVILAREGGLISIPPQLAETVVISSEKTRIQDIFGHLRLQEKKYTAGQIDGGWSPEIKADFYDWVAKNIDKLPVPKAQVQKYLADKVW